MGFRAGFFGVDELRYRIEQMHPAVHLLSPTTSTGSHAVEHYGKAKDLPDLDQADRRTQCYLEHPDAPLPQRTIPTWSHPSRRSYRPGREPPKAPRFKVGDTVTVRVGSPLSHTRRARQIRGLTGQIVTGAAA